MVVLALRTEVRKKVCSSLRKKSKKRKQRKKRKKNQKYWLRGGTLSDKNSEAPLKSIVI